MKLLESLLYKWAVGTQSDFIQRFQENENLYQQARNFWKDLDNLSLLLLLTFVVVGLAVALWFYYPFNNRPGRHYRPKYWWFFFIGAGVASFLITLGLEYSLVSPLKMAGATTLVWEIAAANLIWVWVVYVVASIIICNVPFKTNAYRWFKFY